MESLYLYIAPITVIDISVIEVCYHKQIGPCLKLMIDRRSSDRFLGVLAVQADRGRKELQNDPYKPHSGCDIDIIEASGYPPIRRQRIGKYRAEYFVDEEECTVYVTDIYLKHRDSVYGED